MGHRHTPEEFGSASGVRSANGGSVAATEERVVDSCPEAPPASLASYLACAQARGASPALTEIGNTPVRESTIPVQATLLALRFYKAYLSILFAGSCRFDPTCSQYAYQAIERFGVARGIWLGLKRLLRCHPLSRRFGYDPVPEKWEEMPKSRTAREVVKTEARS